MSFYNIAFINIRRNFKNYKLYILSTTFIVSIYYIFNAIAYNPIVINQAESSVKYNTGLISAGVVIAVISAVFIWYSSSFFIRNRKKELGMYSLFGIRKSKISLLILIENMMIAIMSIIIGMSVGIVLSKLFIMLIFKIMRNIETVKFAIPLKAVRNTVVVFIFLFLLASFISSFQIYRLKLIDLFSAHKKKEKEPKSNLILTIISISLIIFGYWLSQCMYMNSIYGENILLSALTILLTVIIGTFGFFSFAIIFITKQFKKNKSSYYKGVNLISISNLAYRLKSHARTLAVITVLSASAMTAMGTVYCLYYDQIVKFNQRQPFSMNFELLDEANEDDILNIIKKYDNHKITGSVVNNILTIKGKILCNNNEKNKIIYDVGISNEDMGINVISESQYNEIMITQKEKNILDLKEYECLVHSRSMYGYTLYTGLEADGIELNMGDNIKKLDITNINSNAAINWRYESLMIIVDDALFEKIREYTSSESKVLSINIKNTLNSEKLSNELANYANNKKIYYSIYYQSYMTHSKTHGVLLFSTFFAGIVFLITTGCAIYFKMITEAENDKEKYDALRKIGFRDRVIKKAIKRQIFIMFMLPLFVGIMHALFALSTFSQLFTTNLIIPIIINIVSYAVIYFIYYLLTVNHYNKICVKGNYSRVM